MLVKWYVVAGRCFAQEGHEMLCEVEEHQQLNRAVAVAYAAEVGATVVIISNRQGRLEKAVEQMVGVLK